MPTRRRVYEELRQAVEERGGRMYFVRSGSRWGVWEIWLDGQCGRFESNVSFRQACMTAAEGRRYRRLSDEQPMEDSR